MLQQLKQGVDKQLEANQTFDTWIRRVTALVLLNILVFFIFMLAVLCSLAEISSKLLSS